MKLDVQSLSVTLGENHILKDASFSIDSEIGRAHV